MTFRCGHKLSPASLSVFETIRVSMVLTRSRSVACAWHMDRDLVPDFQPVQNGTSPHSVGAEIGGQVSSIPSPATTSNFLKRNGFRASLADYPWALMDDPRTIGQWVRGALPVQPWGRRSALHRHDL
jgi:hypothetical protein